MERKLHFCFWGIMRFCILFALALYAWNFFRSYFLFLALILMVCGPIFSFLMLWSHRDLLRVQATLPDNRVGKNTDIPLDVNMSGTGRFAAFTADITYSWGNIFTGYSETTKRHLWFAPGGSRIKQYMNSCYAGRVEVRIESFEVFDLFHMFGLRGCGRSDAHVIVWPSFSEACDEDLHSWVEGFPKENELKKRGTDYNPDYEVREYIPGDELKSIHWKLSAKQEQLMVRQRLSAGREKMNVLLPLRDDRQYNDSLMESAYALCRLLLHKEYPVQLYWPGHGESLRGCFVAELGELENAVSEILSDNGLHQPGEAEEKMSAEHPTENYILIRTGAYKGAYIR